MKTFSYKAEITLADATGKTVYGTVEAKDRYDAEWNAKAKEYKLNPGAYWVRIVVSGD